MNDAAAREAAHREYVDYITNAYKQPQRVRDQDTPAGEPGLISHDEPTYFSRPRITDGAGNCSELAFSRPGWACSPMPPPAMPAKPHMRNICTSSQRRGGGFASGKDSISIC